MRKTVNYTATEGRDKGKVFVLTEMPAAQGESWAMRALLALLNGNVNLPNGLNAGMGMSAMAELGLKMLAQLKWEDAKPLMDEMFSCVKIMGDPTKTHIVRELVDEDIEEISTRVKLRAEVFKLHTDFFQAAAHSISGE